MGMEIIDDINIYMLDIAAHVGNIWLCINYGIEYMIYISHKVKYMVMCQLWN
jgi:hypothetical protein